MLFASKKDIKTFCIVYVGGGEECVYSGFFVVFSLIGLS